MSEDGKADYYDVGGIEVMAVIEAKLTPEWFQGFLLGNAIKYQLRMLHKNNTPNDDARKAAFYSNKLMELLNSPEPPTITIPSAVDGLGYELKMNARRVLPEKNDVK